MQTILAILLLQFCAGILAAPTPRKLRVTALTGANGKSTLQCWELNDPFVISTDPGLEGNPKKNLGIDAGTYVGIKPYYDGKLHQAPIVQYVTFLSGLVHITIPDSKEEAWIQGGTKDSLILAADTPAVSNDGHRTEYLGKEEVIGIGLRVASGVPPSHTVINQGSCPWHKRKPSGSRN